MSLGDNISSSSTLRSLLESQRGDAHQSSIGTLKFILTCCILAMGFLSVFAPRHLAGTPAIFSLGNMMASGVLLAAGLVHQLADSAQILNQPDHFPWAMFIAGFTFLLFMVVEESLHLALGEHGHDIDPKNPLNLHGMMHGGGGGTRGQKQHHHSHSHSHSHQHSHHHGNSNSQSSDDDGGGDNDEDNPNDHSFSLSTMSKQADQLDKDEERPNPTELQPFLPHSAVYEYSSTAASVTHDGSCARMNISCSTIVSNLAPLGNSSHHQGLPTHSSTHSHQSRRPSQFGSFLQSNKSHSEDPFVLTEHHHHDDHIDLHLHGSILASGILMVALSIHSILAGISIGIETQPESITGTAVAILAHKSFEGFALGSSLVTAQLDRVPFLVLGISFACATPLGIILGQLLIDVWINKVSGPRGDTTIAIVQAIVAGTFLYIAIVEIGAKELLVCRHEIVDENGKKKAGSPQRIEALKLGCFVVGFLAMSALAVVI